MMFEYAMMAQDNVYDRADCADGDAVNDDSRRSSALDADTRDRVSTVCTMSHHHGDHPDTDRRGRRRMRRPPSYDEFGDACSNDGAMAVLARPVAESFQIVIGSRYFVVFCCVARRDLKTVLQDKMPE